MRQKKGAWMGYGAFLSGEVQEKKPFALKGLKIEIPFGSAQGMLWSPRLCAEEDIGCGRANPATIDAQTGGGLD
jgi:hypothetical protein